MYNKKLWTLFLLCLTCAAMGQDVYLQNFEQDPGWQSTRPDLVYWEEMGGYFYTRVQDDGTQYYGISPAFTLVEDSSFIVEFDVNPVQTGWGTYPDLIFKHESEGLHRTREDRTNQRLWDLRFEVHWDDHNYKKFILIFTQDGVQYALPFSPTFQQNNWYHHHLAYDLDSETLTWTVTDTSTGLVFHEASYTGCRIGAFNQVVAGHQGVQPHYGYGRWCTTLFDNLRVAKSAPDEADASAGLLTLIDQISLLDPSAFKKKNRQTVLKNKLEVVITLIAQGDLSQARDKLANDIGKKVDGCALFGQPDAGDWIVDCQAQETVYGPLLEVISILDGLI